MAGDKISLPGRYKIKYFAMKDFQFRGPGTIICRTDSSADPDSYKNLALKGPILVVTDRTLVDLGISDKVQNGLKQAGLEVFLFDDVEPEPKTETVRRLVDIAKKEQIKSVLGLGGGSPMDVAKIAALLISHPQSIASMYGVGNAKGVRLPLTLIPTTAGTGSEGTPVAVVTGDDGEKSPIVGPQFICDHVILDPGLTLGLPSKITATTGIDAIVHAIEAYTSSVRKNPVSDHLAIQSLQFLYGNIRKAVKQGNDIEARSKMLLGAMMAGLAFANASVGAVHALAYPLGTQFHLSHGESNAVVLAPVMRFNLPKAAALYAELWNLINVESKSLNEKEASKQFIDEMESLIPELGLQDRLSLYGIQESNLEALRDGALNQERLLSYNIRELDSQDIYKVFQSVL